MSPPPFFRKVDQVVDLGKYRQALYDCRFELSAALAWADHLAALLLAVMVDEEANRDWELVSATLADFRTWYHDTREAIGDD